MADAARGAGRAAQDITHRPVVTPASPETLPAAGVTRFAPNWGLSSVERDDSRDQLDRCEKVSGEFVIAGRNGSKVLNFIEEALDEVALAVKCEIAIAFGLSVGFGRNYRRDFSLRKAIDERISVVGLVCDQGFRIGIFNQGLGRKPNRGSALP